MDSPVSELQGRARGPVVIEGLFFACLGAATWAAWLSWSYGYYVDPAVGTYQGPYRPPQVIACALTLAAVTVAGSALRNPILAASGLSVGFCLAWTVQAGSTDETGTYLVGALLLVGVSLGTGLCALLGHLVHVITVRLISTARARG